MNTFFRCKSYRSRLVAKMFLLGISLAVLVSPCACKSLQTSDSSAAQAESVTVGESVITILHTNDTHSQFDEVKKELVIDGQHRFVAMGGYARLSTKINQTRQELAASHQPVLLLDAGDAFQGSLYFTRMQGLVSAKMMNFLQFDAMVVGNHEFDLGSAPLAGFADNIGFPLLGANLDITEEPLLKRRIKPFVILEKGGEKIGVIGLVRQGTSSNSSPSDQTHFLDEVVTTKKYVGILQTMGVDKIVLLTHVGYEEDLKLAEQIPGVDVIVGGHSHTLLGDLSAAGLPGKGAYPTIVAAAGGGKVCVVQAWERALAIGRLDVYFDADGKVTRCKGALSLPVGDEAFVVDESHGKRVPLSSQQYGKVSDFLRSHPPFETVLADKKALAVLQPYKDVVDKFGSEKVAYLKDDLLLAPFLDGSRESPPISQAATLVTKAFLWKLREQGFAVDGVLVPLAAVRKELLAGPLFVRDAYEVLPSGNTLVLVSIDKRDLTRLLEDAMANFNNFPQLFGLRLVVDMRRPVGSRMSGMELVRNGTPQPLGEFEKVRLAVPSDMLAGAAGYTMNGLSDLVDTDLVDNEVLLDYLLHEKDIAADTSINVEWIAATRT